MPINVRKDIERIRSDLDRISSRMEPASRTGKVSESGEKIKDRMAKMLKSTSDTICTDIDQCKLMMKDKMDVVKRGVNRESELVKTNIQDHPFMSTAIAVGVGLMLGAIMGILMRRSAEE